MPAARVRSFSSFGGGGGGGGRGSGNSANNQDLKRAAACKQPGSQWSSTESSGGGYDNIDSDEYIMSMDPRRRCEMFKHSLERLTRDGRKISFYRAATFERYLAGCPDIPNLKNLIGSDEEIRRVARANLKDSSCDKASEEYFAKMERGRRCSIFMRLLDKRTRDGNKIGASEVPFFEKYLGDCPNAPRFKDLIDNGRKRPSLEEDYMGMKQETRCWHLKVLLEKVLQDQKKLNAHQKAYFEKWMGDCPNAPDLS